MQFDVLTLVILKSDVDSTRTFTAGALLGRILGCLSMFLKLCKLAESMFAGEWK